MNRDARVAYRFGRTHQAEGRMVPPRPTGSAAVRHAAREPAVARDEVLLADTRALLGGVAWAAASSCPFWWALLAALVWL